MIRKYTKYSFLEIKNIFLGILLFILFEYLLKVSIDFLSTKFDIGVLQSAFSGFFYFTTVILLIIIVVLPIIILYRNFCTNEAFLNFGLPLSRNSILLIKKFVLAIVAFLECMAIVLVYNFAVVSEEYRINVILKELSSQFDISLVVIYLVPILFIFIILFLMMSEILCAMSIGQAYFRNKILGTVVGYFLTDFALQIVQLLLFAIFYVVYTKIFSVTLEDINVILITLLVIYILVNIFLHVVTTFMFNKKLKI